MAAMTTTSLTPSVTLLTPFDNCASCGVQAYVLVRSVGGRHLEFCRHHYQVHADALGFAGWTVADDQRAALVA
jgi:hypothetical protein